MATSSSSSTTSSKIITLTSGDDQIFKVDSHILSISQTIQGMIEDSATEYGVPLPNIRGEILSKVLEFCKKHTEFEDVKAKGKQTVAAGKEAEEELKNWEKEFVKVDRSVVFEMIYAANYLNIESLMELTCQTIADEIKDLPIPEIREILNIENDYTPEEEAKLLEELAWAFDSDDDDDDDST